MNNQILWIALTVIIIIIGIWVTRPPKSTIMRQRKVTVAAEDEDEMVFPDKIDNTTTITNTITNTANANANGPIERNGVPFIEKPVALLPYTNFKGLASFGEKADFKALTAHLRTLDLDKAPQREYVFYQGVAPNVGSGIHVEELNDSVRDLQGLCDLEGDKCQGFTTDGRFKSILTPISQWAKWTTEPKKGFYKLKSASVPPEPIKYTKTKSSGQWAGDAFTCEGAVGRNITGNNNDYANYCMFDKLDDAQAYCNKDGQCKGVVSNDNIHVATRKPPVENSSANASFYSKHLYPKTVENGVWAGDAFKCEGATGRNVTGDYANYCFFDTLADAEAYCNSDAECKGFVMSESGNIQATRKEPVTNTTANGSFFSKLLKLD